VPRDGAGRRHRGLENGAGCTVSWARGGQCCCGFGNGVVDLGTVPVWLTASPTRVGEDGGA
jgi:hypothetical protein